MADEEGTTMSDTDTWFLLVQQKRAGRTDVSAFDDQDAAVVAYGEAERRYADEIHGSVGDVDVLLVGASTIEVVKARYPSYFTNLTSKAEKVKKPLADRRAVPAF
jgi:hypothetical protein